MSSMQPALRFLLRHHGSQVTDRAIAPISLRKLSTMVYQSHRSRWRPQLLCARSFVSQSIYLQNRSPTDSLSRPPRSKRATAKPDQENPNDKVAAAKSSSSPPSKTQTSTPFTGVKGPVPHVPTSNQNIYPASLLIYHAGTPLIVFISTTKLAAIFVFIFSAFFIAPQYYLDPIESNYMAAVAVAGGAIPIMINVFAVPSVISYVHLALPVWARVSSQRLHQYLKNLPPKAAVDVTAVRWIWPRVSRMAVSELAVQRGSSFSFKLRRNVPPEVYQARKWYQWRPLKQFLVAGKSSKVKDDKAWGELLDSIRRGWAHDPRFNKRG